MKVTGIGQCSLDHLFIVDSFPAPDTKKEVTEWTIDGGGPVATALVSLSRLGVESDFYGVIGDDEAGRKISQSLELEGVNINGLLKRPGSNSQVAFIAVEKGTGKRTIFWQRPSGAPLRPEELPQDFLENTDLLLLDGLMSEVSIYSAQKAREKDIPVMLDAGRIREGITELAGICDYLVCSEEFTGGFIKEKAFEPEEAIMKMRTFGAKAVTITLGENGSITALEDEIFQTPAFRVNVVDTTGAGDVFHGGYIYGLLQKWDIKNIIRFASAFAALKCRKPGGRAGIPTLQKVQSFLKKQNDKPA